MDNGINSCHLKAGLMNEIFNSDLFLFKFSLSSSKFRIFCSEIILFFNSKTSLLPIILFFCDSTLFFLAIVAIS